MSEQNDVRKTKVTLGVSQTLNTAQYESLVVQLNTEDEISWTTPAERQEKISKVTRLLTDQFQKTKLQVLQEVGVEPKPAWFKKTDRKSPDSL